MKFVSVVCVCVCGGSLWGYWELCGEYYTNPRSLPYLPITISKTATPIPPHPITHPNTYLKTHTHTQTYTHLRFKCVQQAKCSYQSHCIIMLTLCWMFAGQCHRVHYASGCLNRCMTGRTREITLMTPTLPCLVRAFYFPSCKRCLKNNGHANISFDSSFNMIVRCHFIIRLVSKNRLKFL
jgi:hypothetical protein